MKDIDIKKTVLQNGLRILTVQRDSDIFSMGVGVKVGSLYEDLSNNGISHMVEHMLFKGTAKRNMDMLNNDIEKLAGDIDIYTTYHQTILTTSIMKNHSRGCMEIVADMLMNAAFPEKEFKLEKKVVIEEIKMEKDDPEDISYLGLYKAAFPEIWHKLHITGSIKSVRGIKTNVMKDYYKKHYTPDNTAISIVSSYTHEQIVEMADGCFSKWQGQSSKESLNNPRVIPSRQIVSRKKGIGQTHILYGFDIHGLERKEEIALALLNKKIGAGANSILFRELRDLRGYAYNVYSDIDFVEGIRMLYIYAAISEENIKDTISIIDDITGRFAKGDIEIDEDNLRLIKDIFNTGSVIAMESPAHIVEYLLDGELNYDDPWEYKKSLSIMESITTENIRNIAEKVLKNPIIHILSPS